MPSKKCTVCGTINPPFSSNAKINRDYCRKCLKIQDFELVDDNDTEKVSFHQFSNDIDRMGAIFNAEREEEVQPARESIQNTNAQILFLSKNSGWGKSTLLRHFWMKYRNVYGIAGMIVPNIERRTMIICSSGEEILHEVDKSYEDEVLSIGSFRFTQDSFDRSRDELINGQTISDISLLIIDEIGPLELYKNRGHRKTLDKVMERRKEFANVKIIVVVRPSLWHVFQETYSLSSDEVVAFDILEPIPKIITDNPEFIKG